MTEKSLPDRTIIIKGAGEMATGVACSLHRANLRRILMLEIAAPLAVRRQVSFCEAVHQGKMTVEGLDAVLVSGMPEISKVWEEGMVAVQVDPKGESVVSLGPDVLVDATLAKRNLGIARGDAPLVIGLGPGFVAGKDCHMVVETNRGHDLGRIYTSGEAEANTGIPGNIGGYTVERILRAPEDGIFITSREIGELVGQGEVIGRVGNTEVCARIDGLLRGLIRPNSHVTKGVKIGDIDPRGRLTHCDRVSEKARAIGGAGSGVHSHRLQPMMPHRS